VRKLKEAIFALNVLVILLSVIIILCLILLNFVNICEEAFMRQICPDTFQRDFYDTLLQWIGEPYELGGHGTWNSDNGIDCSGLIIEALRDMGFNVSDQYTGDEENGVVTGLIANVFSRRTQDPNGPIIAAYFERDDDWDEQSPDHKWLHIAIIVGSGRAMFPMCGVIHSTTGRDTGSGVEAITMVDYWNSVEYLATQSDNRTPEIRWFSLSGVFSILQ
jgi:hypothetical protein